MELDPQKDRLYDWEGSWYDWNVNTITLPECRKIIRRACKLYNVEPPVVKQHKTRSMSYCMPTRGVISIQAVGSKPGRGAKNPQTALHEAAHWICWKLHGERIQDHGPTFLRVYLHLLVQYDVAPREALEASARKFKLKW